MTEPAPSFVLVQNLGPTNPLTAADVLPLGQGPTELNGLTLGQVAEYVAGTLPAIADGEDGKSLLSGVGAPANALGNVGDFYLDASLKLYGPKAAEGWPAGRSIVGKSAYEIAVDGGFVGTESEWIDSMSNGAAGYAATAMAARDEAVAAKNTALIARDDAQAAASTITASLGEANGIATLDAGGKVPASQLPAFVDDVVEAANVAALPAAGEAGKLYVTTDTTPAKVWRWSGSAYAEIVASPGNTDNVPEGTANLYFTNARAQAALSSLLAQKASLTGAVFSGKVSAVAPSAAAAGFNVGYGSSPGANAVDGDVWGTSGGLFFKVGGSTRQASEVGHTHSYLPLSGGTLTGALTVPAATVSGDSHLGAAGVTTSTLGTSRMFLGYNYDTGPNGFAAMASVTVDGVGNLHVASRKDTSSNIQFWTGAGGTLGERMRLTTTGRLGIGTTDPAGPLEAKGDGTTVPIVKATSTAGQSLVQVSVSDTVSDAKIQFGDSGANAPGYISYAHGADQMRFGANGVLRMVIRSNGNVGINQPTPEETLDVVGNAKVSGSIKENGARVFSHSDAALTSAKITISTADPSGGADGDIWIKVPA